MFPDTDGLNKSGERVRYVCWRHGLNDAGLSTPWTILELLANLELMAQTWERLAALLLWRSIGTAQMLLLCDSLEVGGRDAKNVNLGWNAGTTAFTNLRYIYPPLTSKAAHSHRSPYHAASMYDFNRIRRSKLKWQAFYRNPTGWLRRF